jgi:phosphatidylinositol kinase/protein kinase (PI-3  family)
MDETRTRIFRKMSPYGHLKGWKLATFIVKAGDDVRQEHMAMQVYIRLLYTHISYKYAYS